MKLLAPNGKPSNLTPEQYKLVRTKAFKDWFGDWENYPEMASKVIDENGEPLTCFHGSNEDFNVFEEKYLGSSNDMGFYGRGFYFTFNTDPKWMWQGAIDEAKYYGKIVKPYFIKALNPFDFSILKKYKGVRINFLGTQSLVFLYNIAQHFTQLAEIITIDKSTYNRYSEEYDITQVPISVLPNLIEKYSKDLVTFETERGSDGKTYINGYLKSKAKEVFYDNTTTGGTKGSYIDFDTLSYGIDSRTTKVEVEILLIEKAIEKYDGISVRFHPEGYMTRYPEITEEIKKNHDCIMQSKFGDELVVFDNKRIKLADGKNTTFDGNNPDIRYMDGGIVITNEFSTKSYDFGNVGNSIKVNGVEVGQIHYKINKEEGIIWIYLLETLQKGIGSKVINYFFSNGINIIYGDAVDSIGFWEKMGAVFDDFDENISGYPFTITKESFFSNTYEKGGGVYDHFKKGGKVRLSKTPAPKKERIYGSKVNKPKSSESKKKASSILLSPKVISSINTILEKHNSKSKKKIPLATAKAVVRRGMGAYSSTHRPTISGGKPNSRVAWGLARLNAFVYKIQKGYSKSGRYNQDDDLINELGYKVKKYDIGGIFQGTPHEFDVYSTEYMGTGEGNQVFGWGLYFTDQKQIADYYKNAGLEDEESIKFDGKKLSEYNLDEDVKEQLYGIIDTIQREDKLTPTTELIKHYLVLGYDEENYPELKELVEISNKTYDFIKDKKLTLSGNIYSVTLFKGKKPNEYNLIEWENKPKKEHLDLIINQLKKENIIVKSDLGIGKEKRFKGEALTKILNEENTYYTDGTKNSNLYTELSSFLGGDKEASLFLLRAGIDGIKYKSGTLSGFVDKDGYNYVIFNADDVTIESKEKYANGGVIKFNTEDNIKIGLRAKDKNFVFYNGNAIGSFGIRYLGDVELKDAIEFLLGEVDIQNNIKLKNCAIFETGFVINEEYQNKGYGRKIINKLFQNYKIDNILLYAFYEQEAIGFWEKMGGEIVYDDGVVVFFLINKNSIQYADGGKINFEYTLKEVYPNIFLLEMDDQYDLASSFLRCQAFYEWDNFRGKDFKIDDFHKSYAKKYPQLKPYQEEFYGFNLPSDIIKKCYQVNKERNNYDNFFLDVVSKIKNDNYYLIGVVNGDTTTLNHELAHAFFWAYKSYRDDMTKLVNEIPEKEKLLKILKEERGYGENVLIDEAQAFLSTGLIVNISDWQDYRQPFIERFEKQKNNYSLGGEIQNLTMEQIEQKLGRKLHWWNDDVVSINGIEYKKVFLKNEYVKR